MKEAYRRVNSPKRHGCGIVLAVVGNGVFFSNTNNVGDTIVITELSFGGQLAEATARARINIGRILPRQKASDGAGGRTGRRL